jgi:hypothetical protein
MSTHLFALTTTESSVRFCGMVWISKQSLDDARAKVDELMNELKNLQARAYLIDIDTTGKKNRFIFVRNGEVF